MLMSLGVRGLLRHPLSPLFGTELNSQKLSSAWGWPETGLTVRAAVGVEPVAVKIQVLCKLGGEFLWWRGGLTGESPNQTT